jgi:hypothetical protein
VPIEGQQELGTLTELALQPTRMETLTYCRFAADYLVHLDEEEAELKPLLLQHFGEEELLELQSRIVADVSPEEMGVILPCIASRNVTSETWRKVQAALGI